MTSETPLQTFGKAVREARVAKGWTLERLAHEVLGNQERKSYASGVEKGKKNLSALTVQKFASVLGLAPSVIEPVMHGAPETDAPNTGTDEQAEKLDASVAELRHQLHLSETLVMDLAQRYAEGSPTDFEAALRGLERALEVAAQRSPGDNLDAEVQAIMAEVDRLNEEVSLEAGTAALRRAREARKAQIDEQKAAYVALLDKGIAQAVLARSVKDAVAFELEKLEIEVPDQAGQFAILAKTGSEWYRRGSYRGLLFDLEIASALADAMIERSSSPKQRKAALAAKGESLVALGEREEGSEKLIEAEIIFLGILKSAEAQSDKRLQSMICYAIGRVLTGLFNRNADTSRLHEAVKRLRYAIKLLDQQKFASDYIDIKFQLAIALRLLGESERNKDYLTESVSHLEDCQNYHSQRHATTPLHTLNNMANAIRNIGEIDQDPETLKKAEDLYVKILKKFQDLNDTYSSGLVHYNIAEINTVWAGQLQVNEKNKKNSIALVHIDKVIGSLTPERWPFHHSKATALRTRILAALAE